MRGTLSRFWDVTRMQPGIVALSVIASAGYVLLLTFANTYVMGLVVDRVQASPVPASQVLAVFSPYVPTFVLIPVAMMVVYIAFVWVMHKRILPLSERTSIVVAHRLSTVASLDRIVVLSHGSIVEDGTHAEISRAGGEYERLWDRLAESRGHRVTLGRVRAPVGPPDRRLPGGRVAPAAGRRPAGTPA